MNYHFTSGLAQPLQPREGQRFFISPKFEYGFWWWYDPVRNGWYVGTAPQRPTYMLRIHSRINWLRAQSERAALLKKVSS